MSALQEQVQKLAVKAVSVFQMSPNAAAELPESGAMPQRADEGNASAYAFDWCDTPQFGISELPPGLSVSATAPASSGEPAMLEGKSEKQDGGKVQWKVLWDMPVLTGEATQHRGSWAWLKVSGSDRFALLQGLWEADFSFMWKGVSWMLSEGISKNLETRSRIH